jgi:hypothetical protein
METPERGLFKTDRDRAYGWLAMASDGLDEAYEILVAAADDAHDRGALALEAMVLHDVVRFGGAERVVQRLETLCSHIDGVLIQARTAQAMGVARPDPERLDAAVDMFERAASPLFAAESAAQLSMLHLAAGRRDAAALSSARARSIRATADAPIVSPVLVSLDTRPADR